MWYLPCHLESAIRRFLGGKFQALSWRPMEEEEQIHSSGSWPQAVMLRRVSWCLVGDPSGLLLCVPLLPRREARGSARRQQDPSRRHDRVYQSGQPQGSRSVSF